MSIDPKLSAALIDGGGPEYAPRRLLGCRVRRLCLWHRLLLSTIGSPFLEGAGARIEMRDLRTAIGICKLSFPDSRIRRPWLIPALIWLRVILTAMVPRMPWRPKSPPGTPNALQRALQTQCDAFLEYCGDYLINPEYAIIPRESSSGAAPRTPRGRFPDEFEHACDLIRHGFSEDRAWTMPLGLANFYRADALRAAGADLDVTTAEEKAFQESLPPEYRHGPINGRS